MALHLNTGHPTPMSPCSLTVNNQIPLLWYMGHHFQPRPSLCKLSWPFTTSHCPGFLPWSQHHPSLLHPLDPISPVPTKNSKRWNFRKARWNQFTDLVESGICNLPFPCPANVITAYKAFCLLLSQGAKKSIPRGCCQCYIPIWDEECDRLYKAFINAEGGTVADSKATKLIRCLDRKRKDHWKRMVQDIDFTHSSRKVWKTFNHISGRCPQPKQPLVTANSIAHQLSTNCHFKGADKNHARR